MNEKQLTALISTIYNLFERVSSRLQHCCFWSTTLQMKWLLP